MRLLLDQPISWQLGRSLVDGGHHVVHVRDLGLGAATDSEILDRAILEKCVVITQDTDFGTLLSRSGGQVPSIILFRMRDGSPSAQARVLLENFATIEQSLRDGAIVVVTDNSIRVRQLPIS